jgi:hypothetical protein
MKDQTLVIDVVFDDFDSALTEFAAHGEFSRKLRRLPHPPEPNLRMRRCDAFRRSGAAARRERPRIWSARSTQPLNCLDDMKVGRLQIIDITTSREFVMKSVVSALGRGWRFRRPAGRLTPMSLSAGRQRQVDPSLVLVSPAMAAGEDLAASSVRLHALPSGRFCLLHGTIGCTVPSSCR